MIKRFYILLLAIVASVGMSWAAGIPCTAADRGKVLCSDGSIYATVSDATAASKTAVAMIAYIDTENNKGLALALVEESGNINWSNAIAKCAAKTPTVTGGTWKLASEDEWTKIVNAAGGRNALRDGFSAIGGTNLSSGGNDKYWSSTESSNTEKGRCISFNDTFGGWSDATKTASYPFYARACLAFNIGEPTPTITVGALEHGSVVASPTSAEAGATITLTATPEAGYKLNTIEATYFGAANETLSVKDKKNVGRGITAEYNKSNYLYVSSYDGAYNLTVSTNDGTNLIKKIEIEFYGPGVNDARTNSMLSSDHGSWTFEDGDPCTKATINNINAVSVVLSGSGIGMNKAWFPKTMKVYYDGDVLIDLTDTEDANVKTFTMVDKAVNVFAEFIPTGSCGENLTWEYSPSTGALVISGTGAMSDYDNNMNKAPWYAYRESISSITLPDGLTYIGKHAFRECNNFTQLVVPNSVTEIGRTAFQDCSKLWNLTLPNTLEKIGGAAFERTKISNFTIPEGVTSLDGYVFGECTSLYRVNIHAGVTSLTGNVFYNCTNLNTIYCYVENPVAITGAVFEGVNKANCKLYVPFTSMAAYQAADEWKDFFIKPIPGTAPTLYLDIDGASATLIYGYPEDGKPAYNEEYTRWDNLDYDDREENLKTLTIDASCRENVMTSFKNLFQYFEALETIRNMAYLSTVNVTNMEAMFDYCKNLTELDLHTFNTAKVTNMKNMFDGCRQLVMLDISSFNTSNVTSMYYMFANDDNLEHIYVGDGWNTDNVTEHDRMFQYCGKLPNYNYSYTNKAKAHTGDGGYLTALTQIGAWESGDCDVILYSNGRMSVTKKAGNGNGAMANYANKDAQPWADYRNLVTKLDVEDGVKEIGTCAFYDFREMTQLNISEGVTAIHENAFRNGKKLTILILPSTLRVLGDQADAFNGCPITDIYLTAHPARLTWNEDNDDFIYSYSNPDVHKTTVCHVPANLADAYVAKFITGVEADKQPNVTFEGGMPAVDMITPEDVIALINEIGEVAYTAECKAKIDAAREAYDGLVDEDKAQVTNYETLTNAETAYANAKAAADQAAAAPVIALINQLPTSMDATNTKLSVYTKVQEARAAYDALTAEQKALVTNYPILTAAEEAFNALPPVGSETVITWDKNTGIEEIGTHTTSPAYEGITISTKGGLFGPYGDMLRFYISISDICFEFANTLGANFSKIVLSSTSEIPSTRLNDMGEGWVASSDKKIATWTGDAETVKIWNGITATSFWDVNTLQFTLGSSVSPIAAAQAAVDLINAIPDPVTLDEACVKAIKDAREAVTALGESSSLIDAADMTKLTDAEAALTALNKAEADKVIAKINNIPTPVELKLATRDSIESARAAYDALNADQKALVPADVLKKLTDAEAALAEKNKGGSIPMDIVWDGNTGIEGVSPSTTSPAYEGMTVTVGKGSSFSSYQSRLYFTFYSQPNGGFIFANENGTNITKVVIESTTALTSTMTEVDRMGSGWVISNENKTATWTGNTDSVSIWKGQSFTNYWVVDMITFTVNGSSTPLDSAQAVKDLIDAIPTPVEYPTSGLAIAAALVAYNQLSDAAKGALDAADVQKMTDAAIQYAALDAIAAIEAIPAEIVYDPAVKAAIETAREKYDALIDASKALVDAEVVAKLTNAEQAWADLVALIEHTVTYIGKDGELKNEKVALLNIPNPAPDFNGHEFVRWDVKAGDFLEEGLRIKAVYTPIITTQPAAYDTLVYNGTAQTLIEAGVASDGHIEYRLNEGEWSAELPKADMAAAYVVDYKLVREGHEDYMAGSVNAVIAKAPVTYVAPQAYDTLAYNYNTQVLVTAGQTNDGTIEYSLDPNMLDSWSADLPQAMNAGTYAVYFRVQGDLNHFDSIAPAPVAVTIAKRDIVITAPVAYDTLVYNALAQTLAAAGSADFSTMEYTLTPDNGEGWSADMPQAMDAGTYAVYYRVQGDTNHNDYPAHSIAVTIAQAPLTITAENKEVIYGDAAPEFTATYSGWMGQDDATVISNLQITSTYAAGISVGTYDIVPSGATALNYAMSYVNGTLTVNKAKISVINAEAQKAKFADGHAVAVVLNQGTLDGVKLNDAVTHVTTATFSSAEVAENLTITLFYELQGDEALLANYLLEPTSKIFSEEGVIIEPFLPDNEGKPEDEEAKIQEGIEVYAYGYCTGTGYSLNYHLNSGNPDQYKIEFEDSRFDDVAYEETKIAGSDGHIDIEIPDGLPTGDYKMSVTFRDSRFPWLESKAFDVTFHVNLPETYVKPLFNNTIILVDTCECMTDIQWYHRADATKTWQPIAGATGHYFHVDGQLSGEYFVAAKMNGVPTYTCGQDDMQTLYGADNNRQAKVRAYPNPVVNTTTVSIENSDSYEHNLRIVNLMGIEVMNTTFEGDDTVVNMDGYVTGNYTISVDGIAVKVLKQ